MSATQAKFEKKIIFTPIYAAPEYKMQVFMLLHRKTV